MQRSFRLPLSLAGAAALALAGYPIQPVVAQDDGSAADLGVMEINFKNAVFSLTGVFKVHCKEQAHRIKPVLAPSCRLPLVRTASSLSMP